MWLRYGSHIIDTRKFSAFFVRKNKLLGLDENGKLRLISKLKDKKELKIAVDILGDKLKSV